MSLQDIQNGEDFLDQMLSGLQAGLPWPDMSISTAAGDLFDDQSAFLTTKLRQHQINTGDSDVKSLLLQQQLLLSRGLLGADDSGVFGNEIVDHSAFKSNGSGSIQGVFNGLTGSLQSNQSQNFQYPPLQAQNFGSPGPITAPISQGPTTVATNSAGGGGSGPPAQPRQRVRARRGQATDPHSIAERLRRERIAERMKSLQELVPNANKTDKASMLDEIIDYVKFLQLQVKVLSMSRMGGVAAVAPLVADISTEGGPDGVQAASSGVAGRCSNVTPSSSTNDTMTVAENQVVKLMEKDMGSAMQYLQGKGLCLMPISLATAISTSTATCHLSSGRNNPSSTNLSAVSVKDSTSVSKS